MGFSTPSWTRDNMVATATIEVSVVRIKKCSKFWYASTWVLLSLFFKCANASCWLGPHTKFWSFLVKIVRGFAASAKFDTSLLWNEASPRNALTCLGFFRVGYSLTALTLSAEAATQFSNNTKSRYWTCDFVISHFSGCCCRFALLNLCSTFSSLRTCSSAHLENIFYRQ
jgi:hypothetical protein